MKRCLLVVLAVGLIIAADDKKKGDAKEDKDLLQGTWKITAFNQAGNEVSGDALGQFPKLVFKDDKYTYKSGDEGEEGTFKIDSKKKPKEIDLSITEGSDKGKKQLGIYEIEGDTIKFAFGFPGAEERPKDFTSKENNVLVTVKKEK